VFGIGGTGKHLPCHHACPETPSAPGLLLFKAILCLCYPLVVVLHTDGVYPNRLQPPRAKRRRASTHHTLQNHPATIAHLARRAYKSDARLARDTPEDADGVLPALPDRRGEDTQSEGAGRGGERPRACGADQGGADQGEEAAERVCRGRFEDVGACCCAGMVMWIS
jgi:hypothetical protein